MKYIKPFVFVLLISLLLTGCTFRMSSSIEELISPVSPFGENADVQDALNSYAKNSYSLKTPSGGKYNTSYIFYDIDNDGSDEAFAFFEPFDNLGTIEMALIDKIDNKWEVVNIVTGDGKDIYSIDFDDLNGDGNDEVCVCWDAITNSSNHILSVYIVNLYDSLLELERIDDSISLNNYSFVDFNNDNIDELLLFEINGTSSSAKAELFSLKNNELDLLGETKLDSHITSYNDIQIEKAEDDVRVYVDALGSDGSSMLTEIIYWSDAYDTIVSPFFSYSTGLTRDTKRSVMLHCCDLNNDGLIDIPTDYDEILGLPDSVKAVNWMIYKNTILVHSEYSLSVQRDKYIVIIPNDIIDRISVSYNEDERIMTILNSSTNNEIVSITPVFKAVYDSSKYGDYTIVLEDSGYYYLAKLGNDTDINISIDDLKNYVKSIN